MRAPFRPALQPAAPSPAVASLVSRGALPPTARVNAPRAQLLAEAPQSQATRGYWLSRGEICRGLAGELGGDAAAVRGA